MESEDNRVDIYVCIGSSCHKKGSYEVMKKIKALITENGLADKVSINSAFCLGHCKDGITIKINNRIITGVGMGNIDDIFENFILKDM